MQSRRTTNPALVIMGTVCLLALGIALLSQHLFHMRPCAWCVLQRLIFLLIALFALLSAWAPRIWQQAGASLALGLSLAGIVAAWHQFSVAAQSFTCTQTLADRLISGLGLDAALPWLFGIYASCMDARVTLLGIEYALWGLALFVVCTLLSAAALWYRRCSSQA